MVPRGREGPQYGRYFACVSMGKVWATIFKCVFKGSAAPEEFKSKKKFSVQMQK
jgi:hypothetical protein